MKKVWLLIKDSIRRFFKPTLEEALFMHGIGERTKCSKEEVERLKQMLAEYEEKLRKNNILVDEDGCEK